MNNPALEKLSTAEKARVFDAIHTRTIVDQVHARLAFRDPDGARRFLGHLGANFTAKLIHSIFLILKRPKLNVPMPLTYVPLELGD